MAEFAELRLRVIRQMGLDQASIACVSPGLPKGDFDARIRLARSTIFYMGSGQLGKLSCRETLQIEEPFGGIIAHLQL